MKKKKIATVNDRPIYQKNLDDMVHIYCQQTGRETVSPAEKKKLMDRIIHNFLLLEEAEVRNLMVTEKQLDQQLEELKKQFKKEEEFYRSLEKNRIDLAAFREEIRKSLLIQMITDQEIKAHLKLTADMLENYYRDNIDKMKTPPMIRARHILVSFEKNSSREEAEKKAGDLYQKLQEGEKFERLAQDHSDCPSAAKGGDLGFFSRGQMVPEFEKAAFGLPRGQAGGPVKTQFGFHIIQVTDVREEATLNYPEAKPYIEKILYQREGHRIMEKLTRQLRKEARVEILQGD